MAQTAQPPPGAAYAYEVAQRSLDDQLRRIEAQDGKAGVLIAGAGIFAGFLFSGDSFLAEGPQWLLALAAGLISLAVICALVAFLNQHYNTWQLAPPWQDSRYGTSSG
ncbi:MAG: hypothetical protein H0U16_05185 [Actinobacteria bacterium]|nr:hypothetical protein [Actinomycetota bacterium]